MSPLPSADLHDQYAVHELRSHNSVFEALCPPFSLEIPYSPSLGSAWLLGEWKIKIMK